MVQWNLRIKTAHWTVLNCGGYCRVAMAEWLARRTPNQKLLGSSPAKTSWLIRNHPTWATGDDNGASVH